MIELWPDTDKWGWPLPRVRRRYVESRRYIDDRGNLVVERADITSMRDLIDDTKDTTDAR